MMKRILICGLWLTLAAAAGQTASASQPESERRILDAMKRATHYMMDVASYRGGFVWSYLPTFRVRGANWKPSARWHGSNRPEPLRSDI